MRRSAIERIGGFPVGTLSEDLWTSALLLGADWKTVFVAEKLRYGSAPDPLSRHVKQRIRWV